MYVAMYLLEDWQSSPQPCGCTIERQDDSPKEAIASLCPMHTFAPAMYDCLRQIVATRSKAPPRSARRPICWPGWKVAD